MDCPHNHSGRRTTELRRGRELLFHLVNARHHCNPDTEFRIDSVALLHCAYRPDAFGVAHGRHAYFHRVEVEWCTFYGCTSKYFDSFDSIHRRMAFTIAYRNRLARADGWWHRLQRPGFSLLHPSVLSCWYNLLARLSPVVAAP